MKWLRMAGALVLVGALAAGLVLVGRTQETRRGAYFGKVGVSLWPDGKEVKVGEEITAKIKMSSGEQKVSGVNLKLNFDQNRLEVKRVALNSAVFNTTVKQEASGDTIGLIGLSTKTSSELTGGVFEVATVVFRAKAEGTARVNFGSGYEIAGWNPSGGEDKQLEASFTGASYKIGSGGGPIPTSGDFAKVDFYLNPASKSMAVGEAVKVEARLRSGTTKVSAANLKIRFDRTRLRVSDLAKGSSFDSAPILEVDRVNGLIKLGVLSMKPNSQLPMGEIILGEFKITGMETGAASLGLDSGYEITGYNPAGGSNTLGLLNIGGGSYTVTGMPTVKPTVTPTPSSEYFAEADFNYTPATGTIKPKGTMKVEMWLNSGMTRVSGVSLTTTFSKDRVVVSNLQNGAFESVMNMKVDNSKGEIKMVALSLKPSSQLPMGMIKVAEFEITGKSEGVAIFNLSPNYEIAGYNPGGSNRIKLKKIGSGSYTVAETCPPIPPGCTPKIVQCVTEPCCPIPVCPTATPIPTGIISGCRAVNGVVNVTPIGGPGTCHDIQEAIDVAKPGNIVNLARGEYEVKKGKCRIPFTSGSDAGTCGLQIIGAEKKALILQGQGWESTKLNFGGANFGVVIIDSPGVIVAKLELKNIRGNYEGIGVYRSDRVSVVNCHFFGLDAHPVIARESGELFVNGNIFRQNLGAVAGVHLIKTSGEVSKNLFIGNTDEAIAIYGGSKVSVTNNTIFTGNGGVHVGGGSRMKDVVIIKNNIFTRVKNKPAVEVQDDHNGSEVTVDYNDFWENDTDFRGEIMKGSHNIFKDPLIGGDYCLMPGSPAIGAGEGGVNMGARGVCGGVTPTPVPTCPPIPTGCRPQYVQCFTEPCCPIAVCPTITEVPTGTTVCRECPPGSPSKLQGNANCDGVVDYADFSIWRREYFDEGGKGTIEKPDWQANFDCRETGDRKVTLLDFTKWLNVCLGPGGKCRL